MGAVPSLGDQIEQASSEVRGFNRSIRTMEQQIDRKYVEMDKAKGEYKRVVAGQIVQLRAQQKQDLDRLAQTQIDLNSLRMQRGHAGDLRRMEDTVAALQANTAPDADKLLASHAALTAELAQAHAKVTQHTRPQAVEADREAQVAAVMNGRLVDAAPAPPGVTASREEEDAGHEDLMKRIAALKS